MCVDDHCLQKCYISSSYHNGVGVNRGLLRVTNDNVNCGMGVEGQIISLNDLLQSLASDEKLVNHFLSQDQAPSSSTCGCQISHGMPIAQSKKTIHRCTTNMMHLQHNDTCECNTCTQVAASTAQFRESYNKNAKSGSDYDFSSGDKMPIWLSHEKND